MPACAQGVQGGRCHCQNKLPACTGYNTCGMGPVNMDNLCPRSKLHVAAGHQHSGTRMLILMQMSTHPAQVSLLNVLLAAPVGFLSNESILALLA